MNFRVPPTFDARGLTAGADRTLAQLLDPDPMKRAMIETALSDPHGAVELLTGWLLIEPCGPRATWMLGLLADHPRQAHHPRARAGLERVAAEAEDARVRAQAAGLLSIGPPAGARWLGDG